MYLQKSLANCSLFELLYSFACFRLYALFSLKLFREKHRSVYFFHCLCLCLRLPQKSNYNFGLNWGEVHSFSLEDEFKVTLDSSSVGKKVSQKSVLTTGKDGKAGLLFSNGALITIKPGSRFYLRKYNQKIVSGVEVTSPSKMEEEPSNSELLAHLDFGELIVKAPKLNKGSKMVLSSPLGTAGIRGTMFQLMAVRNSHWRYFRWHKSYFGRYRLYGYQRQRSNLSLWTIHCCCNQQIGGKYWCPKWRSG